MLVRRVISRNGGSNTFKKVRVQSFGRPPPPLGNLAWIVGLSLGAGGGSEDATISLHNINNKSKTAQHL